MQKLVYVASLLAVAAPLLASDPFAGTWKLNSVKTKFSSGDPAKSATVIIKEQGAILQVTATGITKKDLPWSVKYTIPLRGGVGSAQEGDFDGVIVKVLGDHAREVRYMKDGKN